MPYRCFMVKQTDRAVWSLRRFAWVEGTEPCAAGSSAHQASSEPLGQTPARRHPDGWLYQGWEMRTRPPMSDPRWPRACSACGYEFQRGDDWQRRTDLLYVRPDTGEEHRLEDFGPGAMFDCPWIPAAWSGADGIGLTVRLPNGHLWHIDAPSSSGGRWKRAGTPPLVVVTPSIASGVAGQPGYYHGFLGSNGQPPGWLSDHIG